jgi:hypothetical protein
VFTLHLILVWTSFSGMAGGGGLGGVTGIVHAIMTGTGVTTGMVSQASIVMLTRVGEDTTAVTGGMVVTGTTDGFRTGTSNAIASLVGGTIYSCSWRRCIDLMATVSHALLRSELFEIKCSQSCLFRGGKPPLSS